MASWTLADIRQKTRATTGRPDASMMTDSTLDDYINKFYQYVLPKELKIFFGYTYYNFFTLANIAVYTPPSNFQTLNPSVWVDGFPMDWYLSPDLFYQDYPQQLNKTAVATGDGINNSFSFNVSYFPILAGSVYVTDGTQVAQDDGNGGFIAPASGVIDYATGTITGLAFAVPPAANTTITASFEVYIAARPQAILYYDNLFTLRLVPDQVYQVKMEGIKIPTALVGDADVPFRPDLGPLIAYGASLEIFSDFNQMDQYDQTLVQYNRYKDVSMQDTYEEYIYQRSVPAF